MEGTGDVSKGAAGKLRLKMGRKEGPGFGRREVRGVWFGDWCVGIGVALECELGGADEARGGIYCNWLFCGCGMF